MLRAVFIVTLSTLSALLHAQPVGKGGKSASRLVMLDRFFNSEQREDSTGKRHYWHYTWEETSDPGFSILGNLFKEQGATLASLDKAPTKANLDKAAVYIIVDPDNAKDNPHPNYLSTAHIAVIINWVKNGGVLLLLGNDSANCDLVHLNSLSKTFGITFTDRKVKAVVNDDFQMGKISISDNLVFSSRDIFLKDVSPLETRELTGGILWDDKDLIMAVVSYGKGMVFAVGDPWLYNEYIDHRRLPESFDNYGAAKDLVTYLLSLPAQPKTK